MKVKTSELTGQALDWAVAQAIGETHQTILENIIAGGDFFRPSTDWNQGGPLIEKFRIELRASGEQRWYADKVFPHGSGQEDWCGFGYTALSAVCRAIVTAKLGDEIELPAELFRQEPEKP